MPTLTEILNTITPIPYVFSPNFAEDQTHFPWIRTTDVGLGTSDPLAPNGTSNLPHKRMLENILKLEENQDILKDAILTVDSKIQTGELLIENFTLTDSYDSGQVIYHQTNNRLYKLTDSHSLGQLDLSKTELVNHYKLEELNGVSITNIESGQSIFWDGTNFINRFATSTSLIETNSTKSTWQDSEIIYNKNNGETHIVINETDSYLVAGYGKFIQADGPVTVSNQLTFTTTPEVNSSITQDNHVATKNYVDTNTSITVNHIDLTTNVGGKAQALNDLAYTKPQNELLILTYEDKTYLYSGSSGLINSATDNDFKDLESGLVLGNVTTGKNGTASTAARSDHEHSKLYNDDGTAIKVELSGANLNVYGPVVFDDTITVSGVSKQIILGTNPTDNSHATRKQYVDELSYLTVSNPLLKSGSTVTLETENNLKISVNDKLDVDETKVMLLSGDSTVTGLKTFDVLPQSSVVPTNDNDLVTKSYADQLAFGLLPVKQARVMTATTLNAIAISGNTKLQSTVNGAIKIDNINLNLNDRVLVNMSSNKQLNGIYYVSVVGTASTKWELTRDSETLANGAIKNTFIFIEDGLTNKDKGMIQKTDTVTVGNIGVTEIEFVRFN